MDKNKKVSIKKYGQSYYENPNPHADLPYKKVECKNCRYHFFVKKDLKKVICQACENVIELE